MRRPYRKGKPDGYREVHRKLAEAARAQHRIVLSFIRQVGADEDINEVEREEQERWKCVTPVGRRRVSAG